MHVPTSDEAHSHTLVTSSAVKFKPLSLFAGCQTLDFGRLLTKSRYSFMGANGDCLSASTRSVPLPGSTSMASVFLRQQPSVPYETPLVGSPKDWRCHARRRQDPDVEYLLSMCRSKLLQILQASPSLSFALLTPRKIPGNGNFEEQKTRSDQC